MQRPAFLLLKAALLLAVCLPATAQNFLPKSIQFKGDPEYSGQELMAAAGLKEGVVLTGTEMKDHSQKLIDTGVFDTLNYMFDGQDLIYSLTPSADLYPIRLENLPLTPGKEMDAKLHDRFPLYHGKVPAENGLMEQVRQALEEMLAATGIKATVTAAPFTDAQLRKVTAISYSITAPPVVVGEIHLEGASTILDPQAREILNKTTGSPYDLAGSPNQIETYLGNLYRDKGYIEAEIHAAAQNSPVITPEAIRIPFQVSVSPGTLYKFSRAQLAPGLLVTQADFDKQSQIHPGDVATSPHLIENWEFLSRQYHNKGYMNAAIHPTPSFDRAHGTVSYTVTVDPGPVYTLGKLTIENVSDELRAAMLTAWKMPIGAVFNEGAIIKFFAVGDANPTLARVFSAVNCKYNLTLNSDSRTVDLTISLERRH